jgi:hypothetical protein
LFPICLLRTHSVYAQENRGAAEPVGGGTLSQQSQPPQQPANTAPCTMVMGDVRQPDALSTDSTLYAKSTISYSQMNDATTQDGETSATTAQEASSSVVGMPSLNVVGPIPSEVVVDPTSTFPSIPGPTWGPSSVIPANNDASQDWSTPPTTPLYPTTTMVTMPTVWTDMGCHQKRTTGSRLRRQAGNNISCDPAGPSPEPYSPPESSCSSTSATRTSNSPAASPSSPASSDPTPPFPPLLQWIEFAIITIMGVMIIGIGARVYLVRRNSYQWSESSLEPSIGGPTVLVFPGGGRKLESKSKPQHLRASWRNRVLRAG